ncbi:hypothetical protein QHF85_49715, partial [Polyangium sp. 6x1]
GTGGTAGSGGSGASGGSGGAGGSGGSGGDGGTATLDCSAGKVVDEEDDTKRCVNATNLVNEIQAPASVTWADEVVEFSSQYGTMEYSAEQALGAPDVYPAGADEPKAWATQALDNAGEFLTVGFKTPVIGEAVWVYETYNPGAISKITITTSEGDKVIYENAAPATIGGCAHIRSAPTKTCAPISAVRIDLASDKVDGWNEIDAVGILPPSMP